MTLFSVIDVDPLAAENAKKDEYDDHHDVVEKQCIVEQPNKIKQSAHQGNLTRDSSPCGEQETNKQRGELKSNARVQAGRDCKVHSMCSLSGITVVSGLGRLAVRLKCKGYRDNVQQQPDLNKNKTNPDSFFLQNVSKLVCKKLNRR